jgi:hypothetical protein
MEVKIENTAIVIEAKITPDGRIYGLKKYAGRDVKVVVLEEKKKVTRPS